MCSCPPCVSVDSEGLEPLDGQAKHREEAGDDGHHKQTVDQVVLHQEGMKQQQNRNVTFFCICPKYCLNQFNSVGAGVEIGAGIKSRSRNIRGQEQEQEQEQEQKGAGAGAGAHLMTRLVPEVYGKDSVYEKSKGKKRGGHGVGVGEVAVGGRLQ